MCICVHGMGQKYALVLWELAIGRNAKLRVLSRHCSAAWHSMYSADRFYELCWADVGPLDELYMVGVFVVLVGWYLLRLWSSPCSSQHRSILRMPEYE